jgi:glucose/arabinose dehydrogenase
VGNRAGAQPEIWDTGLRNPWRFSFDLATGDLWIGDVGQDKHEEIDAEAAGQGGNNYGWNTMEGTFCYAIAACAKDGLTPPVAQYSHDDGCAVIGGYVYRGSAYPDLTGQYVFSDLCSGNLWAIDAAQALATGSAEPVLYGNAAINASSFGEDEAGELYIATGDGKIFRLTVE